jgi:hypothetical protein
MPSNICASRSETSLEILRLSLAQRTDLPPGSLCFLSLGPLNAVIDDDLAPLA